MRKHGCAAFGIVSTLVFLSPQSLAAGPHDPRLAVVVRSGDAAPVPARVPAAFRGRLAVDGRDRLLFLDAAGTALFAESAGAIQALAWTGEPAAGSALDAIAQAAAGADGSVAFHAALADGRDGVFRIAAGRTAPEAVALTGDPLKLPLHGDAVVTAVSDPAVDGTGRVIAALQTLSGAAAVARFAAADPPEILIESDGFFARALTAPATTGGGAVVVVAALVGGGEALLRLESGASPVTLLLSSDLSASTAPRLDLAPPAVNDAGTVALLWSLPDGVRLERVENGAHATIASPGSPAPGADSFAALAALPPAVDASGGVVFAAWRSAGPSGFYVVRDAPIVVAEDGMDDGAGVALLALDGTEPGPAVAPSGEVVFSLHDAIGLPIDGALPGGSIRTRARGGDPLGEPARFTTFVETQFPWLGGGPCLSPGGRMIFDARVTDGGRGLFRRDPDGTLTAVAGTGDPAPGGGHFDGAFFVYHSIDDRGDVAFLGVAPDTDAGTSLVLYAGGGDGPLLRVLGVGDLLPGSAVQVSGFLPPSPLNASGWLAIPLVLADGSTLLAGYDGQHLFRVLGSGDVLPDGSVVAAIQTGAPGSTLPPLLADQGLVTTGVLREDGLAALYQMPLAEGGASSAVRLLGTGDPVEGGALDPFQVQALQQDDDGRLLFQASFDPTRQYATFLQGPAMPERLAAAQDVIPGFGPVGSVFPHLAFGAGGLLVHGIAAASGAPEGLLLRVPALPAPRTTIVLPAADPIDGFGSPFPAGTPATRLASDRNGRIGLAVGAGAGPQGLLLIDLQPNAPPVAAAGNDQTLECAGPDGAAVVLDGSASSDPDQDPLQFTWTGPFGTATGATASVSVPVGTWTITLAVRDPYGAASTGSITVTVRDSQGPTLAVAATPGILWPPNDNLVDIHVDVQVADVCDPSPGVVLRGIQILDLGGADAEADIFGAAIGQDDRDFQLRANKSTSGGRLYAIYYLVMDRSGNPAIRAALVRVPAHP